MRLLLLLLLCGGISIHSIAQTDCYEEQLRFGDDLCKQGDIRLAKKNWQVGLEYCQLTAQQRNTLQERIDNATQNCSPKQTRQIPDDMVRIQGGDFDMGDTFDDEGATSGEKPTHRVSIATFYMSKYETSFQDFDAFCTATGRTKHWGRGLLPVINVDWYDAVEYCNWRSQRESLQQVYMIDKTTKDVNNLYTDDPKRWVVTANAQANGYRLPTEAEWEYAAREGGKKVRFGNGKNVANPDEINFDASEKNKRPYSTAGIYREKTVEVNSFSPNALGLYNMSGNVLEWCWDWYNAKYYTPFSRDNPKGAKQGNYRVLRGGSWYSNPEGVRAACRNWDYPSIDYYYYVGLRVVARYD